MAGRNTDTLGARIQAAREAAGFTSKSRFAARVGVTATTVWRYENDRLEPRAVPLARIAQVTGVSMEWLVRGVGRGPRRLKRAAA